jgi:hypothetical protein
VALHRDGRRRWHRPEPNGHGTAAGGGRGPAAAGAPKRYPAPLPTGWSAGAGTILMYGSGAFQPSG